jgi:hypothetical protein
LRDNESRISLYIVPTYKQLLLWLTSVYFELLVSVKLL